ncbi:Oidioi.mRNA.OKI2018_I69.chr2.g6765.t1.cds [Oikopleura dioica]|uniref:Oidioi.mRNA.OKI2018_I69.chr2.g6765.t1.cds n=1 Tax=Oikopleura dioica TaxID=34765 RepID=A0ABN7T517_OIKDI|nr:Oidioi.mRNA.OKI2018_I69.chr2.g6765.t1.cds [Oikopleura dioica]
MRQTLARFNQTGIKHTTANRDRFGHSQTYGVFGNIGMGRHYNPTTHFTLEDMRRRSVVYSDVYLDGFENSYWADRKAFRILSPEHAKKARFFRQRFFTRRLFNYCFFLVCGAYFLFAILFTQRYLGIGQRINNFALERSMENRAAREEAALTESAEYVPALVQGYKKLMAPENLSSWANYEPKNEWKPIA